MHIHSVHFLKSTALAATFALLPGLAFAIELPPEPQGVGHELSVPLPSVLAPLPIVDSYRNQTGKQADGTEINKYDPAVNPVIPLLSGFNSIWTLGDDAWAHGGANGHGPKDFSKVKIVSPEAWTANMSYVLKVANDKRTPAQSLAAYYDALRAKRYSVIDGLGPLAPLYIKGSGATTSITHDASFDPDAVLLKKEEDKGNGAGTEDATLGPVVKLMDDMRGSEGTTSPAKYFYTSPRPWRMTDTGKVVQTGEDTLGDKTFEHYESNVKVVPSLLYSRETRGRQKDGGFPSGHTNAAYLSAFVYAYAAPERYAEMMTRASQLGEDRIIAGFHSPLDVIGGRIMATALAAAYLNDPRFAADKKAAYDSFHDYMAKAVPEGETLFRFAHSNAGHDPYGNAKTNAELYLQRMTYGQPQDKNKAGQEMIVPKGAEVLLETRLPYLSAEQRRGVLATTGIDSGYAVIDGSNGWGRLNLERAAGGYGAFAGDVTVSMDAAKGGFNAEDTWSNDISGPGRLTKSGTGSLTLAGDNSYAGGTVLETGTLVAGSAKALGTGLVYLAGGTLQDEAKSPLEIGKGLAVKTGTLAITLTSDKDPAVTVSGPAEIADGTLNLTFAKAPKAGARFPVLKATSVDGTFGKVESGDTKVELEDKDGEIWAVVKG